MFAKVFFDPNKSTGYYLNNVELSKDVSIVLYDYDNKFPDDEDLNGKKCKKTIWTKSNMKTKYEISIYVKNRKIIKTEIPDEVDLKVLNASTY